MRNSECGIENPGPVRGTVLFRGPNSAFRITSMIRYDFAGKVALVTGSSRGIGAATLSAFHAAGATAVLHYWDDPAGENKRDAEALAAEWRARPGAAAVHLLAADVRDAAQVEAMMMQVQATCGGL